MQLTKKKNHKNMRKVEGRTHLQVQFREKRISKRSIEVEPIRSISDDLRQGRGVGGVCVIIGAMETQISKKLIGTKAQKRLEIVTEANQNE